MIAFLKGTMAGRSADTAFVDVNGVGFAVYMPATDIVKLPEAGADVALFTHLAVREDAMTLYGFLSQEEHALFLRLIGVSGIGPKAALAALSTFSPRALADAVAAQDVALVQKIPGVGKKSASRIILELKGSFDASFESLLSEPSTQTILDDRLKGATEALLHGIHLAGGRIGVEGGSRGRDRGSAVTICP